MTYRATGGISAAETYNSTFAKKRKKKVSFNVICLQLAPVPERAAAQHSTQTPVRRASQCERDNKGERETLRGRGEGMERNSKEKHTAKTTKVRYVAEAAGAYHLYFAKNTYELRSDAGSHSQVVIWGDRPGPRVHYEQVTHQKWRPGTPGRTRPILWRNITLANSRPKKRETK